MFNVSDNAPIDIEIRLAELGIKGKVEITAMWSQKMLGVFEDIFEQHLNPHTSGLYSLKTIH